MKKLLQYTIPVFITIPIMLILALISGYLMVSAATVSSPEAGIGGTGYKVPVGDDIVLNGNTITNDSGKAMFIPWNSTEEQDSFEAAI